MCPLSCRLPGIHPSSATVPIPEGRIPLPQSCPSQQVIFQELPWKPAFAFGYTSYLIPLHASSPASCRQDQAALVPGSVPGVQCLLPQMHPSTLPCPEGQPDTPWHSHIWSLLSCSEPRPPPPGVASDSPHPTGRNSKPRARRRPERI